MRLPNTADIDATVALGLLLIAAIGHLTAQPHFCCRECCPQCAALNYYRDQVPHIADLAVDFALTEPVDWLMDTDGQGTKTINWPYLVQFWIVPDTHQCNAAPQAALTTM